MYNVDSQLLGNFSFVCVNDNKHGKIWLCYAGAVNIFLWESSSGGEKSKVMISRTYQLLETEIEVA